jgi:hypothetical protein
MTLEEEKIIKKETSRNLQLDILLLDLAGLLIKIRDAFYNLNDTDLQLKIHADYVIWNIKTSNFLADVDSFDYFTKWLTIKEFQPKKYSKFNIPVDEKGAEIRDKIINDLNELKSIIGQKKVILDEIKETFTKKTTIQEKPNDIKKCLKSIPLVSQSIVANDAIFFVFDEHWQTPIRFRAKNKNGEETTIKKLHNIAYIVNAPQKKVNYDKNLANNINNGLFKNKTIASYMKTNGFKKPTLVQKSESGILVLKNEIPVEVLTIQKVPTQYQSFYIDKTK